MTDQERPVEERNELLDDQLSATSMVVEEPEALQQENAAANEQPESAEQPAASAVASDGEWLSVTVSARVPGAVGSLLPWTLSARAWVRGESSGPSAAAGVPPVGHHQVQGLAA